MPDILSDIHFPPDINPTFGSGGGSGGGRGGGRIILSSSTSITLSSTGSLLADGTSSSSIGSGAGSGGGILMIAYEMYNNGLISAKGGAANTFGAAGGGGRISLLVSDSLSFPLFPDHIFSSRRLKTLRRQVFCVPVWLAEMFLALMVINKSTVYLEVLVPYILNLILDLFRKVLRISLANLRYWPLHQYL